MTQKWPYFGPLFWTPFSGVGPERPKIPYPARLKSPGPPGPAQNPSKKGSQNEPKITSKMAQNGWFADQNTLEPGFPGPHFGPILALFWTPILTGSGQNLSKSMLKTVVF